MAITATAVVTSSGSLTAPKSGDVLTYTVTVTGDTVTGSITNAGSVVVNGQTVAVTFAGPTAFSYVQPESISGPTVTGMSAFVQSASNPHIWTTTLA